MSRKVTLTTVSRKVTLTTMSRKVTLTTMQVDRGSDLPCDRVTGHGVRVIT